MAPHSSTLAWKIPWMEEPGGLQSMGSLRSDRTERLHFHFHALEKEMATHSSVLAWRIRDGGAWWAAVYGVAQSRTRLKRLSSSSSTLSIQGIPQCGRGSPCQCYFPCTVSSLGKMCHSLLPTHMSWCFPAHMHLFTLLPWTTFYVHVICLCI